MNRLFVANKPAGLSSNQFLGRLKRKYGEKKAGYSGTLDPFASGALIVAFGSYTRLFAYLAKTPKVYRATIWLGAECESGDNEHISRVQKLLPFAPSTIEMIAKSLTGLVKYRPPRFSAKRVNGERAYNLARAGVKFEMKECEMEVFYAKIAHYAHPFLTVELAVSEGGYVRSWAQLFASRLHVSATLSALERLSEGEFKFENERPLDPLKYLDLKENKYLADPENIALGRKLSAEDFGEREDGVYLVKGDSFFSVVQIAQGTVNYRLNRIENANTH